jgi:ATP-binding cassette subfamily B (MDR/TAP) protein 1
MLVGDGLMTSSIQQLKQCFFTVGCKFIDKTIRAMCFEKVIYTEAGWFVERDRSSGTIGAELYVDAAVVKGLAGDKPGLVVCASCL